MQDFWLARGISLLLSAKLVAFTDCLRSGRVQARYLADGGNRLHAKIYCGDDAATAGSSNFTRPGLNRQPTRIPRRARQVKRTGELQRHPDGRRRRRSSVTTHYEPREGGVLLLYSAGASPSAWGLFQLVAYAER